LKSSRREVISGGRIRAKWVPVEPKYEDQYRNRGFAVRPSPTNKDRIEVLVVVDRNNVTGDYLRSVSQGFDRRGQLAVNFRFNSRGAQLFGRLTGENTPDPNTDFKRQLGIILDGSLYNAPNIQSRITESGEISGSFTKDEIDDLIAVLRAGSLPATLSDEPVSSQLTDPTLGADTIEKGSTSILISLIAVMIFILFYYRFAGLVACLALTLNLLSILGLMIALKAAFTLPGLAGLVLTVGMSVDANVLIFERIREELDRGAALRLAIRNGFGKAMSTVVDANLTTLITATVLYIIGTDQVRGFAVTLWLGIVMSMFTAIFCSRVIFDIAERMRWIKRLRMMRVIGNTNVDFVGKRWLATGVSLAVIVVGLVAVSARGLNLLNIDFTGGTLVEMRFEQPHDVAEVRVKVSGVLPDVSVSRVTRTGEQPGLRYQINTSEPDKNTVEQKLTQLFGNELATNHVSIQQLAMIEAHKPETSKPEAHNPETEQPVKADDGKAKKAPPAPEDQSSRADARSRIQLASYAPGQASEETDSKQSSPDKNQKSTSKTATPATDAAREKNPSTTPTDENSPPATNQPESNETEAETAADIFVGGTEATLEFSIPVSRETLSDWIDEALNKIGDEAIGARFEVVESGESLEGTRRSLQWKVLIALPRELAKKVFDDVRARAEEPYFPSSVNVGGKVAGNTRQQAIYAMLASLLFIIGYIWIRFQRVAFGLAAVVALVHDVLIVLGALAASYWVARIPLAGMLLIEPFKIDLPIVAALLTIIGYSLNDTIVVFDRIREVRGKSPLLTSEMINLSINQTLRRTLLTSFTTLLAVAILYIGGGAGIRGFAFSLLVGVFVGTYSSIFIASPVLFWLLGVKQQASRGKATHRGAVAGATGAGS